MLCSTRWLMLTRRGWLEARIGSQAEGKLIQDVFSYPLQSLGKALPGYFPPTELSLGAKSLLLPFGTQDTLKL